ncbi:MAG: DUF1846 domain-containing protein [Clostridiales bacterium]|nr:DUF1846 domain-containing protein [Clostridiales bacterium]
MKQSGFNKEQYMELQTKYIRERIERFHNKLYLEFGGKLFDDYHAARVLPGFDANGKAKLLRQLRDIAEIIFTISASAIESSKIRADIGITYDMDVLRLIDNLSSLGLSINSVVITQYSGQPLAAAFHKRLKRRGIRVYLHEPTKGYPSDVDTIVSEEGYGANPYIETTQPLVVVTAPGPGSGKMSTCLAQLYHEQQRGQMAGYAKFETFPIWNLSLKHPVNLAYEAATADLRDVIAIDPYHLEAYGKTTVNYNRDIEVFPLLRAVLTKLGGGEIYKSPTDMGVNMAGCAINDDEVVRQAAGQEIIRRYFKARCDVRQGLADDDITARIEVIMQQLDLQEEERVAVAPARAAALAKQVAVMSIELPNGRIIAGKASDLLTAPSAAVINAIKEITGIADPIHLLSPVILEPIIKMKRETLKAFTTALNLADALIALSLCAATNPTVELAMKGLTALTGCEAHSTVMLGSSDEEILRRLRLNVTCDANYESNTLYNQ